MSALNGRLPAFLRRRARRGGLIFLAVLIAFIALLQAPFMEEPVRAAWSGLIRSADALAQRAGFVIAEVTIAAAEDRRPQIARALDARPGGSILLFDLQAAKTRIEKALPGEARISVRRILPDRIHVEQLSGDSTRLSSPSP